MDKERRCWDCKLTLPIERFGFWKYGKEGRRNQCKSCKSKDQAIRQRTPEGRLKQHFYKIKYRSGSTYKNLLQSKEYKERARKWHKSRYQRHKVRVLARTSVNQAIQAGRIPSPKTLPCKICRNKANHYHHPNGYDRDHILDVIALCHSCHQSVHSLLNKSKQ